MRLSAFICVCENDSADRFKKCCESILSQTVKPDQLVICADGELPSSVEGYISSLENITVVRVISDGDHGTSRQAAFDACKGELVAVMDSDDIAMPDRFEKQLQHFKAHPETDVLGGYIQELTDDGTVRLRTVPLTDTEIKKYAGKRCPFNHMTVMMKRSAAAAVGGYESFYRNEDYYLWVRMMRNGAHFANLPQVLCHVNITEGFYRRRGGVKHFKSEMALFKFMRKNRMISLYRYICNGIIRFGGQVVLGAGGREYIYKKLLRREVR